MLIDSDEGWTDSKLRQCTIALMTTPKHKRRSPDPVACDDPRLAILDRVLQRVVLAAQHWGEAHARHDDAAVGDAEDELRLAVTALSLAPRKWARPG
jgi:hypothetical protein